MPQTSMLVEIFTGRDEAIRRSIEARDRYVDELAKAGHFPLSEEQKRQHWKLAYENEDHAW